MLCVSIGNVGFDDCLNAVKNNELCELRLDRLKFNDDELKKVFSEGRTIIAAYRPCNVSDNERSQKLRTAVDLGASYIDIEVDSTDPFKAELVSYAKSKKCKVIVSYHNYEKTPLREELTHIVEWCKASEPDVIKIACKSRSDKDNARLIGMLDSDVSMIVIGMGEKGKTTRILAPKLGAFCTYVSLSEGTKTAPGQLTKDELEKFLNGLHYV